MVTNDLIIGYNSAIYQSILLKFKLYVYTKFLRHYTNNNSKWQITTKITAKVLSQNFDWL